MSSKTINLGIDGLIKASTKGEVSISDDGISKVKTVVSNVRNKVKRKAKAVKAKAVKVKQLVHGGKKKASKARRVVRPGGGK